MPHHHQSMLRHRQLRLRQIELLEAFYAQIQAPLISEMLLAALLLGMLYFSRTIFFVNYFCLDQEMSHHSQVKSQN